MVWHTGAHWFPLLIDLRRCEVWVFDSLQHRARTDPDMRRRRYADTLGLRRLLPTILQLTSFYEHRPELRPLEREWDLRFAHPQHCFEQHGSHSCGPFSVKTIEVLLARRAVVNVDEDHMKIIREQIAERIFSFSLISLEDRLK
jgi:Ulp1 protease family, C-terminal catalytic domain